MCTNQSTLKCLSRRLSVLHPLVHKQLCHDAESSVAEQLEFLCGWRRAERVLICLCAVFIAAIVTSVIIPCGGTARETWLTQSIRGKACIIHDVDRIFSRSGLLFRDRDVASNGGLLCNEDEDLLLE